MKVIIAMRNKLPTILSCKCDAVWWISAKNIIMMEIE